MRKLFPFLLLLALPWSGRLHAQNVPFTWVHAMPTPVPPPPPTFAPGVNAAVLDFVTDAAGNSYLAGMFRLQFNVGPGVTLSATGLSSPLFVVKFDPGGAVVWTRTITGPSGINPGGDLQYSLGVAVDTVGHVYLAGELPDDFGTFNFGNGLTAAAQCTGNCTDVFLAQLDADDGAPLWVKTITGQNFSHLTIAGVVAEPDGDCFIGGDHGGETIDFGQDSVYSGLQSDGLYLAKFDPAGALQWVRLPTGPTSLTFVIARGPNGHVYLNGKLSGLLDLGNNVLIEESSGFGNVEFFIAEFDANGVAQRGWNINAPIYVDVIDIAVDRQNRLYVATDFDDLVRSGEEVLAVSEYPIHSNALLRYADDTWTLIRQLYYTNENEFIYGFQGIAIDSADRVYTGGWYDDTYTGVPAPPNGLSDLLLTCSSPNDTTQWMARAGGNGAEAVNNAYYGKAMGTDAAGNLYLAGEYRGGLQLGTVSMGGYGLFVARIASPGVPTNEPGRAGPAIRLSPNPTAGAFTLSCPPDVLPATATVRDVHGRAVFQAPVAAPETTFALGLPAGVYVVEVAGRTGMAAMQLVVGG